MLKNKKGFTLTELIVVVAILGILAAVVSPLVIGYVNDAKVKSDASNAATLTDAVRRGIVKGNITEPIADDSEILPFLQEEIGAAAPAVQQTGFSWYYDIDTKTVTADDGNNVGANNFTLTW